MLLGFHQVPSKTVDSELLNGRKNAERTTIIIKKAISSMMEAILDILSKCLLFFYKTRAAFKKKIMNFYEN